MSKIPSIKELAYFHVRGFSWEELSQKHSVPLKDLLKVEEDPQWPAVNREAHRGLRRFLRNEMVFLLRESAHDENPRIALDARKTLLRYLTPKPRPQTRMAPRKPEIPETPKPVPVPVVEKTAPPAKKLGMLGGISTLLLLAFSVMLFLVTVAGGVLRTAKSPARSDSEGRLPAAQLEKIFEIRSENAKQACPDGRVQTLFLSLLIPDTPRMTQWRCPETQRT